MHINTISLMDFYYFYYTILFLLIAKSEVALLTTNL